MIMIRTSPSYGSYAKKSEELNAIENAICSELKAFNNQHFTLYAYNQQKQGVEQYRQVIHSDTIFSSKLINIHYMIIEMDSLSYSMIQQKQYIIIVSVVLILLFHHTLLLISQHYSLFIIRFISLIQSFPPEDKVESSVLLIGHNLSGLLFHLPLIQLIYSYTREKDDPFKDDPSIFSMFIPILFIQSLWRMKILLDSAHLP